MTNEFNVVTGSEPRRQILELLKRNGTTTIDEFVDLIALSKTAVRAHLVKLEEAKLIQRVEAPSDSPGRPPASFRITQRGGHIFPADDAALLTDLLEFIEAENAPLVRAFFERLWVQRYEEFESSLRDEDESDLGVRRLTLERLLQRTNFMPEVIEHATSTGIEVTVRECNCPFPAAVRATRIPCELEQAFLERALGGTCVGSRYARDRSDVCTFRIRID